MTETDLLQRIRAATGPDREIDSEIGIALCNWGDTPAGEQPPAGRPEYSQPSGHFTSNTDAAIALVQIVRPHASIRLSSAPDYWYATIQWDQRIAPDTETIGKTPALALIAALLMSLDAEHAAA